jgi:hypothetical protein
MRNVLIRLGAIVVLALVLLLPTGNANASSTIRGEATAATAPVAVVIRVNPNFQPVTKVVPKPGGGYRVVDDYADPSQTLTSVNLFPFFVALLVVGGVAAMIWAFNE